MPDETCRAFDSVALFGASALHRLVVGADPEPRKMTPAEVKALGDPFASLLLARGKVPRSGEELVEKIKAAVPAGDPGLSRAPRCCSSSSMATADAVEKLRLRGQVLGESELHLAPAPRISAERVCDRALVRYSFPRPARGELPPATYPLRIAGARGTIEHPLALDQRRYVVRASGFTRERVGSETVEVALRKPRRRRGR